MNPSLMSFLLVLLVEGITVFVAYLKDRLNRHMHQRDEEHGFGQDPEYT